MFSAKPWPSFTRTIRPLSSSACRTAITTTRGNERDLRAAGFNDVEFETVDLRSKGSAREAAIGLIQGSPMRAEIEPRAPDALNRATDCGAEALRRFEGPDGLDAPMAAHIVIAAK